MHELLTHTSARVLSARIDAVTEDEYNAWGQNSTPTLTTHRDPEYSHELRHLIRQCLNLKPSLRPTVEQILKVTGPRVLQYEAEAANKDNPYQLPKLYFKQNEINHMPLGPHLEQFGHDFMKLAAFAFEEDQYAEHVWGPIKHPQRNILAIPYHQLARDDEMKQRANLKRARPLTEPSSSAEPSPKRNRRTGAAVVDSVDAALLASRSESRSSEDNYRFARRKRMRLWNDMMREPTSTSYEDEEEEEEEEEGEGYDGEDEEEEGDKEEGEVGDEEEEPTGDENEFSADSRRGGDVSMSGT